MDLNPDSRTADADGNPGAPKTPPKEAASGLPLPKIDSTPFNAGTARASEYLQQERIEDVKHAVAHDLRTHLKNVHFEEMLKALIMMVKNLEMTDANEGLATECLEKCLELAANFLNSGTQWSGDVRKAIADYCACDKESARYKPLAEVLNYIVLGFLDDAKVTELLGNRSTRLYKINDPAVIASERLNNNGSKRKPDLISLLESFVRLAQEQPDDHMEDVVRELIPREAYSKQDQEVKATWEDVCKSIELKCIAKIMLEQNIMYTADRLKPEDERNPLEIPEQFEDEETGVEAGPSNASAEPSLPEAMNQGQAKEGVSRGASDTSSIQGTKVQGTSRTTSTPASRRSARTAAKGTSTSHPEATQGSSQSKTRKRKGDSQPSSANKKPKTHTLSQRLHPAVQLGLYAAERLRAKPWITHTPGILITDEVLHLWWYDQEGCIQTHGLNFVANLPHFVVMVLLFQHLKAGDMGFSPVFRKSNESQMEVKVEGRTFRIKEKTSYSPFGLFGRGTSTVNVNEVVNGEVQEKEYLLKVSWQEKDRLREGVAIRTAEQFGKDDPHIGDHIPTLIASESFDDVSTDRIRRLLKLESNGGRVLCLNVVEILEPITNLQGEAFWTAFCQVIRCHYLLWQKGLHHGDISVNNLMHKDGKGILNDWDLARLVLAGEEPKRKGHDRTGTMAFMALDLLTPEGWKGQVQRLYRHELESFMWVLVWITMCFTNGDQKIPKLLRRWIRGDNADCAESKDHFLPKNIKVTTSYNDLYWRVFDMHSFWKDFDFQRQNRERQGYRKHLQIAEEEPHDLEVLKQMVGVLCGEVDALMIRERFAWVFSQ